jgi:hypothetical protein
MRTRAWRGKRDETVPGDGVRRVNVRIPTTDTPGDPECPAGQAIGAPDFVGVGVQRAGTTWWFHQIAEHPQVHVVPGQPKEQHFFDRFVSKPFEDDDVQRYYTKFPKPPGSLVGEWTPRYMHDFWVPPLIVRTAPNARLLVMLRDPVERFVSGVAREMEVRNTRFLPLIGNDAVNRGRYHLELSRLRAAAPNGRLLVLQYERCVADPHSQYRRTLEFLGVDDTAFVPAGLETEVVEGGRKKPKVPANVIDNVASELADDVARLAAEYDIDLELWPNFVP